MRSLAPLTLAVLCAPAALAAQDLVSLVPGDTIRVHASRILGAGTASGPDAGLTGRLAGIRGDTLLLTSVGSASPRRIRLTPGSRLERRVHGHSGGRFARWGAAVGALGGILAANAMHDDEPDAYCTGDLITSPIRCHEVQNEERSLLVEMFLGAAGGTLAGAGAGWLVGRLVPWSGWEELETERIRISGSAGPAGGARIQARIRY